MNFLFLSKPKFLKGLVIFVVLSLFAGVWGIQTVCQWSVAYTVDVETQFSQFHVVSCGFSSTGGVFFEKKKAGHL